MIAIGDLDRDLYDAVIEQLRVREWQSAAEVSVATGRELEQVRTALKILAETGRIRRVGRVAAKYALSQYR